jgi:hypothetical protein|tara:strand:- start:994 stop:1191 length:198 start_codon:yes stop_codon:yes gene_type:complete
MKIKIIDESELKKSHKIRDASFEKYCNDKKDDKTIKDIKVIRNSSGEITLWEVSHIHIEKKEVSE